MLSNQNFAERKAMPRQSWITWGRVSYVGRHNQSNPAVTRRSRDGRDRTQAEVVDTYNSSDKQEGRVKEQQKIDALGGVKKIDNKRNEIRPRNP